MSALEKPSFPEADAWTDNMPDISAGFKASSARKTTGGSPSPSAHDEYRKFAKLDLGDM